MTYFQLSPDKLSPLGVLLTALSAAERVPGVEKSG